MEYKPQPAAQILMQSGFQAERTACQRCVEELPKNCTQKSPSQQGLKEQGLTDEWPLPGLVLKADNLHGERPYC
jgi:hypothetical protein